MHRLLPFEEYKKIIEAGKQRAASNLTGIECPCCKCELLFKNEPKDQCITCPGCNWDGEIPS